MMVMTNREYSDDDHDDGDNDYSDSSNRMTLQAAVPNVTSVWLHPELLPAPTLL